MVSQLARLGVHVPATFGDYARHPRPENTFVARGAERVADYIMVNSQVAVEPNSACVKEDFAMQFYARKLLN